MVSNLRGLVVSFAFVGTVLSFPDESFDFSLDRTGPLPVSPELREALIALQPLNETEARVRPLDAPRDCECGVKGVKDRIVGGTVANDAEWPWQAFLFLDDKFKCGGSVISKNWIVTAAHCAEGTKKIMVYLGINNIERPITARHVSRAGSVIIHEKYEDSEENGNILFDIALLELKTPIPAFDKYIKPICLPYKFANRDFEGEKATATGWGDTKEKGEGSTKLLKVTMPVFNSETCGSVLFKHKAGTITDDMICTYKEGADSCQGDSGGPLNWVARANLRTYLIGIVSFGTGCAREGYPGVYVKVTNFLRWINAQAGQSFCRR